MNVTLNLSGARAQLTVGGRGIGPLNIFIDLQNLDRTFNMGVSYIANRNYISRYLYFKIILLHAK